MACIGRGQLLPGVGTGVQCALSLLLLGATVGGVWYAGPRVNVARQAASDVPPPDQSRTSFARIIPALPIFAAKLRLEQVVEDDGRIDEMLGILGQGGNSKVTSREPK